MSSHITRPAGSGKPKRGGYLNGDMGRLQGTEGLPLNRAQRRAKERQERHQKAVDAQRRAR